MPTPIATLILAEHRLSEQRDNLESEMRLYLSDLRETADALSDSIREWADDQRSKHAGWVESAAAVLDIRGYGDLKRLASEAMIDLADGCKMLKTRYRRANRESEHYIAAGWIDYAIAPPASTLGTIGLLPEARGRELTPAEVEGALYVLWTHVHDAHAKWLTRNPLVFEGEDFTAFRAPDAITGVAR